MNATTCVKPNVLLFALLLLGYPAFAQQPDSTKHLLQFRSAVSVTNNGFSFIPSFSLGKPATIINLAIGGKRFSFEPELRFSLAGKPWSFIFIWRYKLVNTNRLQFTVGAHLPALAFRTVSVARNGETQDLIQTQRFVTAEVSPTYFITKNVSVGLFYLYGRGIEADAVQNTHFLSLRGSFSNIRLSNQYVLRFNPQVFYLKTDDRDGVYVASNLILAKQNFPLSLSTMMNKPLRTEIPGKVFDWNISLIYSFSKNFARQ